jgi:pimeloyl-ACP methyl ester carboxylesterase
MTGWILLRGLTREARHWGALPERLAARLGGLPVVALDLPGNGTRWRERSPTSIDSMVAASRDALRAAGREPPYVLVGMSLGAMVAMAWATSRADEITGLVLINSSSRGLSPWHERLRWRQIPALLRIVVTRDALAHEQCVLRLTSRHPPQPEASLLTSWAAWRRERPVSSANAMRQLLAAACFRGVDVPATLPTLVLNSDKDALVDPACSLALARAWGAELRVHPTAGHDLALDDGGWVAEQIAAWWLSIRPQA